MDDDERRKKLEAGKAKLASFRKKRSGSSPKNKRSKSRTTESAADGSKSSPITDDALKSVGAGDSTAVQTGDDNSDRGFTASEDSDISTTADEMSTEEEASYAGGLSPRERIQELELTVSDQQVALQKLTLENKELGDRELELEETLISRNAVIRELQKNVTHTAQQVKQLQATLSHATDAVKSSDGEQSQVVAELVETRQKLKTYQEAIEKQSEAMKQLANKLEEKSVEAEEAQQLCKSLKVDLQQTIQSQTLSSEEAMLSLRARHDDSLRSLRAELEEQHGQQIAAMKKEMDHVHQGALQLHRKELELLRESQEMSSSSLDHSDVIALQEQVSQLSLQLESTFREADRAKRDHDLEVVKLNQQLIGTIDEYEEKLKTERDVVSDLEHRLDMQDAVNSEIQGSFSKQLQQLEDERDEFRSKLRDAQSAARDHSTSAKVMQDLEDQLTTYKEEIIATEKQLEERNTQCRKLQEEVTRRKDEANKQENENKRLIAELAKTLDEVGTLKETVNEKDSELDEAGKKFVADSQGLEEKYRNQLQEALKDMEKKHKIKQEEAEAVARTNTDSQLKQCRDEHSNELKNLHTQHHRQMEELKNEMEKKLQGMKEALETEKKEQLGVVKDVHERNRDREFQLLKLSHEDDVARNLKEHEDAIELLVKQREDAEKGLKQRFKEDLIVEENRIRREMQEDFDSTMEKLREELLREKEHDLETQKESLEQHYRESKDSQNSDIEESYKHKLKELTETEKTLQEEIAMYKQDIENLKKTYEEKEKNLLEEHVYNQENLQVEHRKKLEDREEEMRRLLQEQREEQQAALDLIKNEALERQENERQVTEQLEAMQQMRSEAMEKLEDEYREKFSAQQSELNEEREKWELKNATLMQELDAVTTDRESILNQAEESRKRLETLHQEDMFALQEELNRHIQDHKQRTERMKVEMEATRASRSQLQELKDELIARNASVEQAEIMRAEFTEREESLHQEHQKEMEILKQEYDANLEELRQKLESEEKLKQSEEDFDEMKKQVEEYKEKLAAAQANLASLAGSSPMRPVSSASDYDPANISAMNNDYRNALTITHISDVSGIGEELEEGALHVTAEEESFVEELEEGELPTLEEGDLKDNQVYEEKEIDEGDKSQEPMKESELPHQSDLGSEVENLTKRIQELENEIKLISTSHNEELRQIIDDHETSIKQMEAMAEKANSDALSGLEKSYAEEREAIIKRHDQALRDLEEDKRNEMTQLRFQCASDTATQVEEELKALQEKLDNVHRLEMESLKHELEIQMNEKVSSIENKLHEKETGWNEEIDKLTEDHSKSTEERIAAVMQELYEQKQEAMKKVDTEHKKTIVQMQEDREKAEKEIYEKFKIAIVNLEADVNRLNESLEKSENNYNTLKAGLETGDNDSIRLMKQQHEKDLEELKTSLEEEYNNKLNKQAEEVDKAQNDFVNEHQQKVNEFLQEREADIQKLEEEKQQQIQALETKYKEEVERLNSLLEKEKGAREVAEKELFEEEKRQLKEEHNEELKVVATRLVEVIAERDELIAVKNKLETQLHEIENQNEKAQAELKSALITNHMEKFQGAITELDQHHMEELEKLRHEHEEETKQYKKVAEDLIQKLKDLEEEYKTSVVSLQEEKASSIESVKEDYEEKLEEEKMQHDAHIISMREAHDAQMKAVEEEHDAQLHQIEEEIAHQDQSHRDALNNILETQAAELEKLQFQFDLALKATKSDGDKNANILQQKVNELEHELKTMGKFQDELQSAKSALKKLQAENDSWQKKSEIKSDSDANSEDKMAEQAEILEKNEEEMQELRSRIEFERAEYESEIEQLQDELRNKDDNVKELNDELEKKSAVLERMNEKFETVTTRREREGHEEDNLIRILREDLDRINDERDQLSNANQQLLSTLTEIIKTNNKCEDLIMKKMRTLSATAVSKDSYLSQFEVTSQGGASEQSGAVGGNTLLPPAGPDADRPSSSCSKFEGSVGSFVDEGLDLSQRLAESMFLGPDLDSSAREVATSAGTRLMQTVERLLEALHATMQQLNVAQQAQFMLGEEMDEAPAPRKVEDEATENDDTREVDADELKRVEGVLAEYMNSQIQLEHKLQEREEEVENLRSQLEQTVNDLHKLKLEEHKLLEEKNLFLTQKEALVEGRSETELNLLKATEQLAAEKQALADQYEASRMHYEKQTQLLEESLDLESRKHEDKEKEQRAEVEDLYTQIEALQKHISSNSKFSAEQTTEREIEREQFQQEIGELQTKLDEKQKLSRSDSNLSHEPSSSSETRSTNSDEPQVSRLEEELEIRDQNHKEQIQKMQDEESSLKKILKEYEENLQELRERSSESELDQARAELQEISREREVLQQDLYDNLLKVSSLEAKLDHYKHGTDVSVANGGSGDHSQVERLRRNLDQEREAHESKDNEIEHLVGVHSQLRNEIIEKEEEIENLLREIENYKELEAENIKLKEDLHCIKESMDSFHPTSRAEELSALSKQLLDEKNAEIDELQQMINLYEDKRREEDTSEPYREEQESALRQLQEENDNLKANLQDALKKVEAKEELQKLELEVSGHEDDVENITSEKDELITSLKKTIEGLMLENGELRKELGDLKNVLTSQDEQNIWAGIFIPPQIKEKIRDLEELFEKEKECLAVPEHSQAKGKKRIVGKALVLTHDNSDSTDDTDIPKVKQSNIIREKLKEIENELKSYPENVLSRILLEKDNTVDEKDSIIGRIERENSEYKDGNTKLKEQVADLQHELREPDVRISMREKTKDKSGKVGILGKDIDVEKESEVLPTTLSADLSSSSSYKADDESDQSDEDSASKSDRSDEVSASKSDHDDDDQKTDVVDGGVKQSLEDLTALLHQQENDLRLKNEAIEDNCKLISDKEKECSDFISQIAELQKKYDQVKQRLSERLEEETLIDAKSLTEEEIRELPVVQTMLLKATENVNETLNIMEQEIAASKEEKERLLSDLSDVQREYMALLAESRELQQIHDASNMLQDKIVDLEGLVAERESELQQAQQENFELQGKIQPLIEELEILKQEEQEKDKSQIAFEKEEQINQLQEALQQKDDLLGDFEGELEKLKGNSKAYNEEIDLLQDEQEILNSENAKLLEETEQLKSKINELEKAVYSKQQEITEQEEEFNKMRDRREMSMDSETLEDAPLEEGSLLVSSPLTEETSRPEDIMKMHHMTMEQMKANYSQEISNAVDEARRHLQEEQEAKIKEIENQHNREIAEILSESLSGESELARRLRSELDHADQLDNNLIGHLTSNEYEQDEPKTDSEISSKLQELLKRLHKEGVQVLSLSELQFIKHHHPHLTPSSTPTSPPATVEEAQQTSLRLEEDISQLKRSWENEKLALLNAIQALKELVAQTNGDETMSKDMDTDDRRGDLLHAVSDVFEREHDALLAELRTSVVESQQAAKNETGEGQAAMAKAAEKLAELERKVRKQGVQHTSALERLVSADRNSLLVEVRDLREDRRKNLSQAEERIQQLEGLLSNSNVANTQNNHMLQSQVERLEYKLQQERAVTADARASLEAERLRATDILPALQRERDRSLELDTEIGKLQKKLAEDAGATRVRTENLQAELDEKSDQIKALEEELSQFQRKLNQIEDAANQDRQGNERAIAEDTKLIRDLEQALTAEKERHEELIECLKHEQEEVAKLQEMLATLRADSKEEAELQNKKCSDLEDAVIAEKRRNEDMNVALKREQDMIARLRKNLEEERESSKEARQNDRATIGELRKILDDARMETDRVQRKMDIAERDAKTTRRQLEDTCKMHNAALDAERGVRDQLQSTLENVQEQKKEMQGKLHTLEDIARKQRLSALAVNAGVPAPSDTAEGLLAHRRKLESSRQRLQLEAAKLQDLTSKTAQRIPLALHLDEVGTSKDAARALAAEIEQIDSVKRTLSEMQQELREMYPQLSMPKKDRSGVLTDPSEFNDCLLEQNAELTMLNARQADEKMSLRDALRRLEEEVWKAKADQEDQEPKEWKHQQLQMQEMASRMHRLYTRYLRAESFRKALVYQKKYLLLLIGGFQDCEEATLALIARMGAYPNKDDCARPTHRSKAFKRFRTAVRVVIAVSRLKFLVRKWNRTSHSVSASIQERHGTAPVVNGHHHSHRRPSPSVSPNLLRPSSALSAHGFAEKSPSPTPLPRYRKDAPYGPYKKSSALSGTQYADTPPTKLTRPPPAHVTDTAYGTSGLRSRSHNSYTRPITTYGDQPSATGLRYLNGSGGAGGHSTSSRPHSSLYPAYAAGDSSSLSYSRAQPAETDPSLNEYIQKLENLQHRLEQNPHRYPR